VWHSFPHLRSGRKGADGGFGCKQALRCMPHTELACDGGGSSVVPGLDSTLGGLGMEAEGSSEGSEGGKCPHCSRWGSLKERVISAGQRPGQAHSGNLLQGPLQGEGKEERSERVALPFPTL
jgi:hypothetical protein